jgi:hypothetical protein
MRLHLTPESPEEHYIISQILQQEDILLNENTRLHILEKKICLQCTLKAGLEPLPHEALADADCSIPYFNGELCAASSTQLRTGKILVLQNANQEYVASLPDSGKNKI